jgi:hypothetical protein
VAYFINTLLRNMGGADKDDVIVDFDFQGLFLFCMRIENDFKKLFKFLLRNLPRLR